MIYSVNVVRFSQLVAAQQMMDTNGGAAVLSFGKPVHERSFVSHMYMVNKFGDHS